MTASSFCPSTSSLRSVLCAVLEPNNTPSGTMTAVRPPGLSRRQEEGEEEQLGLLGLHHLLQVPGAVLVVERAGKWRISQDKGVFLVLPGVILGERVTVDDVGIFHAVQQQIHAADAQHSIVEIKA